VADLGDRLLEIWPSYVAYAVSFLTIGIVWVNHHAIMEQVERADRVFLFLNVGFLLVIAFIPFPTRLVAEHIQHEGATAAAFAYEITLTATAATSLRLRPDPEAVLIPPRYITAKVS
jgi:TMEM175 potassium channel family protein